MPEPDMPNLYELLNCKIEPQFLGASQYCTSSFIKGQIKELWTGKINMGANLGKFWEGQLWTISLCANVKTMINFMICKDKKCCHSGLKSEIGVVGLSPI